MQDETQAGSELSAGLGEEHYEDQASRRLLFTVACGCGETRLHINWIKGPYCGGYLKVTCPKCGASRILFDDFA